MVALDTDHLIVYHMMHNGSDTMNCGASADSACFSLLHVLKLYYAKPPTMGLLIITDMSSIIDENLMVRPLFLFQPND